MAVDKDPLGTDGLPATEEPAEERETDAPATASDTSNAAATTASPTASGARSKLSLRIGAGLGALLLVASIVAAVIFYVQYNAKRDLLAAQESSRAAACAYAPALANYDFNNLDPYFKSVVDGATGDWKKQFEGKSNDLRTVLVQGQVKSQVKDVQCALKSGDNDHAEVILIIGQSITSVDAGGQPQPGQLTMALTLDKTDERWLISRLSAP